MSYYYKDGKIQQFEHKETVKDNTAGCGCLVIIFIVFIPVLLDLIVSNAYIKRNNAPLSCMFARDTVTCVQIFKNKE